MNDLAILFVSLTITFIFGILIGKLSLQSQGSSPSSSSSLSSSSSSTSSVDKNSEKHGKFNNQGNNDDSGNESIADSSSGSGIISGMKEALSMDIKMVLCVRRDLGMTKGKVAAQCCHACLGAYRSAQKRSSTTLKAWEYIGEKKITLSVADEKELENLAKQAKQAGLPYYLVQDAGHTQVEPGSRTVLAIGPASSKLLDPITGKLKLY